MSARSIVLRLLLCLALVLNGAAPAWAGVHDHAAPRGEPVSAVDVPPCHASMPAADADENATTVELAGAPAAGDHGGATHCCNGDACACACLHHAPATMAALSSTGLPMRAPLRIDRTHAGHAPPPAPVLIRPPIG